MPFYIYFFLVFEPENEPVNTHYIVRDEDTPPVQTVIPLVTTVVEATSNPAPRRKRRTKVQMAAYRAELAAAAAANP